MNTFNLLNTAKHAFSAPFSAKSRQVLKVHFSTQKTLIVQEKELEQQGAFNEEQIRALMNSLLPVLQFIHHCDVIHRDIKPTNILRQKVDNKFVLIDFGVAKQLAGTSISAATPHQLNMNPTKHFMSCSC